MEQVKEDDFVTPPSQLISTVSRQKTEETLSTVTMLTESIVTSPAEVEKKVKLTRETATAAKLHCIVRLKQMKEYNTAFKRATIMYAREKEKRETGMSARNVVDLIKNNCKVQLCPRTIQKKVKEGAIESSPLRRGPSGNIPEHHYRNLCVAFEKFNSDQSE